MDGKKQSNQDQSQVSRTTRLKLSRKDLRQSLFKKLQRVRNQEEAALTSQREKVKEDDIF